MTEYRENILFYCSIAGANTAAIYNTFIETCKQVGIPFQEYFKKFSKQSRAEGRTTKTSCQ